MSGVDKSLLRLAAAVHMKLSSRTINQPLVSLADESWQRCQTIIRQMRRAQLRGWQLAEQELRKDLAYALAGVEQEISAMRQSLPSPSRSQRLARMSHVYGDLRGLAAEFAEFEFDLPNRWVSVTSEPITLQGVYLGPFEIRLHWERMTGGGSTPYRIIARDPHPCESRENVPHPHVMDEVLCEGEGRQAIRQALQEGRLLDFFLLVVAVLRTYNPESPFVELAMWHGTSCADCGALAEEDNRYDCQKCGATVCGECERNCCGCDDSCCADCIGCCVSCDDQYCRRCLTPCLDCRQHVCAGCLNDNERCPNCHEEESGNDEHISECDTSTGSSPAEPHGLGQTAVLT